MLFYFKDQDELLIWMNGLIPCDAEKRSEELQSMFDWLYERNNKVEGPCKVWVECVPMN